MIHGAAQWLRTSVSTTASCRGGGLEQRRQADADEGGQVAARHLRRAPDRLNSSGSLARSTRLRRGRVCVRASSPGSSAAAFA